MGYALPRVHARQLRQCPGPVQRLHSGAVHLDDLPNGQGLGIGSPGPRLSGCSSLAPEQPQPRSRTSTRGRSVAPIRTALIAVKEPALGEHEHLLSNFTAASWRHVHSTCPDRGRPQLVKTAITVESSLPTRAAPGRVSMIDVSVAESSTRRRPGRAATREPGRMHAPRAAPPAARKGSKLRLAVLSSRPARSGFAGRWPVRDV
jgi:hypothetical protein